MEASVLIPFYKDIPALDLILDSLNRQSAICRFEVIIAEDDDAPATIDYLEKKKSACKFPIQHISHPDKGFRKCKALNDAVKVATTDYLIFIDGDCLLHPKFIEQYLMEKEENKILYGRRVNLSEKITQQLYKDKKLGRLHFLNLLFSGSTRVKEALYLPFMPAFTKSTRQFWGCNWAILKKHFLDINGYDEDYIEYGFEDLDIYKRMEKAGYELKSVKFQCIMYHLYHITRSKPDVVERMKNLYESKMKEGFIRCKNGIEKIN